MKTRQRLACSIVGIGLILVMVTPLVAEIFLPGMQPTEADIEFAKVQQCRMCHAGTPNGVADPTNTVHGPYGDGAGAMPHHTNKSEYHASLVYQLLLD
ncbi:hypothetical protein ACFL6U_04070 [Planctomycetota bacterium]